jgi:hypothetical protein
MLVMITAEAENQAKLAVFGRCRRSVPKFRPVYCGLIEIERARRRLAALIFLGLLQQLVEFLFAHFFGAQMRSKAFLEDVVAARCFAFQLLDGGLEIFDRSFLLRLAVVNHRLRFGIDPQSRSAARALDVKERAGGLRHNGIVAHA